MDKNSNSIEVLILGNSHAFDGINPKYIQYKTFNFAYHSQEFIFDELLVEKYIKQMKNLKCIVFTMSYFTLFEKIFMNGVLINTEFTAILIMA